MEKNLPNKKTPLQIHTMKHRNLRNDVHKT